MLCSSDLQVLLDIPIYFNAEKQKDATMVLVYFYAIYLPLFCIGNKMQYLVNVNLIRKTISTIKINVYFIFTELHTITILERVPYTYPSTEAATYIQVSGITNS